MKSRITNFLSKNPGLVVQDWSRWNSISKSLELGGSVAPPHVSDQSGAFRYDYSIFLPVTGSSQCLTSEFFASFLEHKKGAGQDVGRSCVIVSLGGRNIMFDCGMHMGYNVRNINYEPELDLRPRRTTTNPSVGLLFAIPVDIYSAVMCIAPIRTRDASPTSNTSHPKAISTPLLTP